MKSRSSVYFIDLITPPSLSNCYDVPSSEVLFSNHMLPEVMGPKKSDQNPELFSRLIDGPERIRESVQVSSEFI